MAAETPDTAVFERRESVVLGYCRGLNAVLTTGRGSVVWDTAGALTAPIPVGPAVGV